MSPLIRDVTGFRNITKVTCDHCGKKFIARLEETVAEDGVIQQMTCSHCKHVSPIARITAKGVELRARLEKLRDANLGTSDQFRRVLDRYQREVTPLR